MKKPLALIVAVIVAVTMWHFRPQSPKPQADTYMIFVMSDNSKICMRFDAQAAMWDRCAEDDPMRPRK